MTITSPLVLIKSASYKIMNENKTFKTIPSDKLSEGDVELDRANREEMLTDHKFIEAYSEEYKYIAGYKKPNYTRIANHDYFKFRDTTKLKVASNGAQIYLDENNKEFYYANNKTKQVYINEKGEKTSIVDATKTQKTKATENWVLEDLDEVVKGGFFDADGVATKIAGDNNLFYTDMDPDSKEIKFDKQAPQSDTGIIGTYNSWQKDNDNQYYSKNEKIIMGGINFLLPIINRGKYDSYSGNISNYNPMLEDLKGALPILGLEGGLKSIYTKAETITITTTQDTVTTNYGTNAGGAIGNRSNAYSATSVVSVNVSSVSPYDMVYGSEGTTKFKAGDYILLYKDSPRYDVFEKYRLHVNTGTTKEGKVTISLPGEWSFDINLATNLSPEDITTAIAKNHIIAGSVTGAVTYMKITGTRDILFSRETSISDKTPFFSGVLNVSTTAGCTFTIFNNVSTTDRNILKKVHKSVRIFGKVNSSYVIKTIYTDGIAG